MFILCKKVFLRWFVLLFNFTWPTDFIINMKRLITLQCLIPFHFVVIELYVLFWYKLKLSRFLCGMQMFNLTLLILSISRFLFYFASKIFVVGKGKFCTYLHTHPPTTFNVFLMGYLCIHTWDNPHNIYSSPVSTCSTLCEGNVSSYRKENTCLLVNFTIDIDIQISQ
jgi:hypothetical protein